MRRQRAAEREPPGAAASLEIATRFLSTRPRSRWEVERRLRRARTEGPVLAATLDQLARLGLIDDLAFGRWWIEQRDRHAPRGRRLIEAELRHHGVGREVVELLREELAEVNTEPGAADAASAEPPKSEEERARNALAQHLRGRPLPEDRKALQRLGMFLVRRGFDPDAARAALRDARDAGSED